MARIALSDASALVIAAGQMPGASDAFKFTSEGTAGAPADAVKASLDLSTLTMMGNLDTVVQAVTAGVAGNKIKVSATGDSPTGAGVTIAITYVSTFHIFAIHYEDGVSTVEDVEDAIDALLGQSKLIEVKTPGTASTVLAAATDDFTANALTGGADPVGKGHNVSGLHIDEAIITLSVSAWGAAAGLELVADRSNVASDDAPASAWGRILPTCELPSAGAPNITTTSGKIVIANTLPTDTPISLRVPCPGALRVRVGIRQSAGMADAMAACTVGIEFVQRRGDG